MSMLHCYIWLSLLNKDEHGSLLWGHKLGLWSLVQPASKTTRRHQSSTSAQCSCAHSQWSTLWQLCSITDVQCPILCSIRWSCHWLRVDYGNATLAGLPASQLRRLQSVLKAAARLIHRSSRYVHVTPMLRDLHWLRSSERIHFKLGVLISDACMVWRHGIFPTTSSASPIPTVAVSGRRILTAGDPTNMAAHCWRSCVTGGWKLPLEQSAARPHLSSNAVFCRNRLKTHLFSRSFPSYLFSISRSVHRI